MLVVCRRLDTVAEQVLATAQVPVRWLSPAKAHFHPGANDPPHAAWAGVPQAQDADETVIALADWRPETVVVDHYAFDARWHQAVRAALGCRLLVIDDTADRALDADALLDHNWHADHRAKYAGRLLREPLWLCGPRFALLGSAYQCAPRYRFHDPVRSIGIFMGGTDPDGVSGRALAACRAAGFSGPVEVVSTSANPHLAALRDACAADGRAALTLDEPDLAAFFARHDLQIGAGGGATWERCCIGVPSLTLAFSENQKIVMEALSPLGVARVSGAANGEIEMAIRQLFDCPEMRQRMVGLSTDLVDGFGGMRVALSLLGSDVFLRRACFDDARKSFSWRNALTTRRYFRDAKEITRLEHEEWWRSALCSPSRHLLVAQVGKVDLGILRLDFDIGGSSAEVSIYLDPRFTGLALGGRLLRILTDWVRVNASKIVYLEADVSAENAASVRSFRSAGYFRIDDRCWRLYLGG